MNVVGLLLFLMLASDELASSRAANALLANALETRRDAALPLSFDLTATVVQPHQSLRPQPPFMETRLEQRVVADPANARFIQTATNIWPTFTSRRTTDVQGTTVRTFDHVQKSHATSMGTATRTIFSIARQHPDLLLHMASANRASIRQTSSSAFLFAGEDGTMYHVHLQEGRVTAAEWLTYNELFGDMNMRVEWDWKNGEPAAIRQLQNGRVVVRGFYSNVKRGRDVVIADGATPEGYAEAAAAPRASLTFVELGPDLELLRDAGGPDYHSLLVRLRDRLIVIEGPRSPAAARRTISAIRDKYPSLPISDLVVTHHHDDHVGGIRAYAEAGARIVTTRGNVEYLRGILSASHTLSPSPARAIVSDVTSVETGHRYADVENEVILFDAGPTDHAAEVLVAWLPRQKVIFQGDLFRYDPSTPEPARNAAVDFARLLEEKGLDVQKIVGVHGEPATPEHLEAAIARRQQAR